LRLRESREAACGNLVEATAVAQPLVIAYHLVWTAYGWWLPNDPRGSGSQTIRNDTLTELGELHHGRKKAQPTGRMVREFYERAAPMLQHPLLTFDQEQRAIIADAYGAVVAGERYTCYACAVMPDHVHILIRKHKHEAETMAENLMRASRARLIETGHREPNHPTWISGHGWKVFLDHPDEVRRTIRYIERNPVKIGLPAKTWDFLRVYDDWPLHPGHSPNSPYAKRLRDLGRYP
jgi:REP element-mobilizing transposase RayT